ncbi:hypothetical protein HMPREF1326_01898 [Akkermansia sp. KLE1605]|nr:hypothetical protein HMPREF1326_01898 [Akkermansia sp. KLE1605]
MPSLPRPNLRRFPSWPHIALPPLQSGLPPERTAEAFFSSLWQKGFPCFRRPSP